MGLCVRAGSSHCETGGEGARSVAPPQAGKVGLRSPVANTSSRARPSLGNRLSRDLAPGVVSTGGGSRIGGSQQRRASARGASCLGDERPEVSATTPGGGLSDCGGLPLLHGASRDLAPGVVSTGGGSRTRVSASASERRRRIAPRGANAASSGPPRPKNGPQAAEPW